MIWDFFAVVLNLATSMLQTLYSLLPDSPFYLDAPTLAYIATVAGYSAWFFPINAMFDVMVLAITALVSFWIINMVLSALALVKML